jgi:stage III sporulation protein AH
MKHIFRKNQVIITALAIMIAVAGYLQFNQDKVANYGQNTKETMDVVEDDGTVDVDADAAIATDDAAATSDADAVADNDETADISDEDASDETIPVSDTGELEPDKDSKETAGEAVLVNNTINADFFASAKLEREQTRAKNKDILMDLVDNTNLTEEQKEDAINGVIELTAIAEKETATEMLLEAKGFDNAVVSIADERVNVVVSAEELTDQQKAQIEDIVKNETKADVKNITISPVKVEEQK